MAVGGKSSTSLSFATSRDTATRVTTRPRSPSSGVICETPLPRTIAQSPGSPLSDSPVSTKPDGPWPPNSFQQTAAADPIENNCQESDTAHELPMDEIAIDEDDIIIAVMGPTGVGKTTACTTVIPSVNGANLGSLISRTKEIRAVRYSHPDCERKVVLVDTPGFDDTCLFDSQILQTVAEWLKNTCKQKVILSGILYFLRISQNRVTGTPLRNLNMFNELCGRGNFKNIVLVTTMWDKVSEDVGLRREKELQNDIWQWMTRLGSTTHRFLLTGESARDIINIISGSLPDERRLPRIQRQVVDENKPLHMTPAGKSDLPSPSDGFSCFKGIPRRCNEVPKGNKVNQDSLPLPSGRHHIPRLPSSSSISSHASGSSTKILRTTLGVLSSSEIAIDETDIVIAVMGPTSVGKSTFVARAVGLLSWADHGLISTKEIRAVPYPHPDGERNIVLVDTPGFDDTVVSDTQILRKIAEWLKTTCKRKVTLSGLLYFHRISDNGMGKISLKILDMFQELCGTHNFKNVVLVTTMWDQVVEDVGLRHEQELQNDSWKSMIRLGSTTRRFHLTKESAWDIINPLYSKIPEVIVVMGSLGVGKSSFIRDSVPPGLAKDIKVGHSLQSETDQVQPVSWVAEDGTSIVLVDTPGFYDSREGVTDAQVLKMIATFLTNEYGKKSQLTGLVYVHRISDPRVGGTSQRNLRMFRKLCGTDSLKNVVIVTTMWDKVTPEEGSQREQELMSSDNLFKPLLDGGATMMRYERTAESATKVINHLLRKKATTTQIVREIVQETKTLEETAAGRELRSDIQALLKRHDAEMECLKEELRAVPQSSIEWERKKLDGMVARLSGQLEELRRGIPGQIGISDSPLRFEPAINFPVPDTKSVVQCINLLQLVKIYESTLVSSYPNFSSLIASRAIRFANAVEKSVKDVQRGLSTLTPVLTSKDMDTLQQFMKADPHPRSFTRGAWTKAREDMEFVANETKIMLSKLPKPGVADRVWNGRAVKRFDALTKIFESAKLVVVEMETMVDWWTPVIDALLNVEDATRCMEGYIDFNDSTVTVALSHIIHALDSYCEAYARCTEDLLKTASEILKN